MAQHRSGTFGGFSARYNLSQLLHFEEFGSMDAAIAREKQLKSWSRKRKDDLISNNNPEWKDLLEEE
jgi:putative endonuclease